jgi:protein SCO1
MKAARSILTVLLLAGPISAAAQDEHEHHRRQAAAPAPEKPAVEAVDGLDIPDVPVIDQDGKALRFYSDLVKDRIVAVNFVFTTCTTICPPMGANFARLQKLLGDRCGRDMHLISVSVDPATDTPERLKAWSRKFGAGPGWTLITGERAEIVRLLKALGVYTPNINDHSPLVLLGDDARHRWTRAYGLAPPVKLAELIGGLIGGIAAPAADAKKEPTP